MPAITTFSVMMFIIKQAEDLGKYIGKERMSGKRIGFVPTMGALHEGHLSLVRKARAENDLAVCSIFINPVQFNDTKDFERYPKTPENDILLLENAGCDVLFFPGVEQIYPPGTICDENYDLGYLEAVLEGKYRPGHFQGVCRVVSRLMRIVQPSQLYIGQKDYQQCMVIKRLLFLIHSTANVVICPTLREPNGLAMSSRNLRLSDEEKKKAGGIFEALSYIRQHLKPGPVSHVLAGAEHILTRNELRADYLSIAGAEDLRGIDHWDGRTKAVALIAAFMGEIRLIDNIIITA